MSFAYSYLLDLEGADSTVMRSSRDRMKLLGLLHSLL
jgi:hypothetical protein